METLKIPDEDVIRRTSDIVFLFGENKSNDVFELKKSLLIIWFRICFGKDA